MKKNIIIIIIIIMVVLILLFLVYHFLGWQWLAGAIGGLGAVAAQNKKKGQEVIKKNDQTKKKAEKLSQDMREKDKKFKDTFFIFLILIMFIPFTVFAEDGQPPPDPSTMSREQLEEKYIEALEWAIYWRDMAFKWEELYYEVQDEFDDLKIVHESDQRLIENYQKIIQKLIGPKINLNAGVGYVPLHPDYSQIQLAVGIEF